MKITFVIESSYGSGGMERMLATIANAMSESYDISVVTAFNNNRKEFFPLNDSIERTDLGIVREKYSSPKEVKSEYKKRLADFLTSTPQDIVISLGSLEFFFLPEIKDGSKKIFWFHFAFNYDVMTSRKTSIKWMNTLIGKLKQLRRIKIAKKYDAVVVLSKNDYESWHKYLNNVTYIYNPLTIRPIQVADYGVKRAIAVGRLEYQKGFDYLIQAWAIVHHKFQDWELDIYGKGTTEYKNYLKDIINRTNLQGIVNLMGRSDNISKAYSHHSIMILSSRYEGFGLVLVEAATCGLPLVSFDCEQGPSEIIENGKNGYLVSPVGNVKELADKIMSLMASSQKREEMGKQAKIMSERFSLDRIKTEWLQLINKLMSH